MCDFRKLSDYANRIFLETSEVAELLGLSTETVRQMARSGRLSGEQTGDGGKWVFRYSDIKGFCTGQSFLRKITHSTQVFWVTWDERVPAADWCKEMKVKVENVIRNSISFMEIKEHGCAMPKAMRPTNVDGSTGSGRQFQGY